MFFFWGGGRFAVDLRVNPRGEVKRESQNAFLGVHFRYGRNASILIRPRNLQIYFLVKYYSK